MLKDKTPIVVSFWSKATSFKAQGAGTAYINQLLLLTNQPELTLLINKTTSKTQLVHIKSIHLRYFLHMLCTKKPVIMDVHFLPSHIEHSLRFPPIVKQLFLSYVKNFYRQADYLIVVNPFFIPDLEKLGISSQKIAFIPNYVSKTSFFPLPMVEKRALQEKYRFQTGKFYILGVGQLQSRKGILDFIQFAAENPQWEFCWAGNFVFGVLNQGYWQIRQALKTAPKNFHYLGYLTPTELQEVYNLVDVFLLPSYSELCPMSILEAANVGLPIVLRALPEYTPLFKDQCLYFHTSSELALLLTKLATNKDFYLHQVQQTTKLTHQFSETVLRQVWIKYYQSLLTTKQI